MLTSVHISEQVSLMINTQTAIVDLLNILSFLCATLKAFVKKNKVLVASGFNSYTIDSFLLQERFRCELDL